MTYVVTEKCVDCKFTSCVSVCPVDAFHELPDQSIHKPRNLHRLQRLHGRVSSGSNLS